MVLEANSTSLATVSLRVAGLFGIGDRQMIPRLVDLYKTGQTKVQVGDNTNLFDYTYIENAAHAHLLAADKLPSPDVAGNSFFITNTTPIPFWDMPRRVWGILGLEKSLQYTLPYSVGISIAHTIDYLLWAISPIKKIEITLKPYAIRHSCANRYFNTEKAQNILGYKPLFSLEEGLQKTLKNIIDEKSSKN
jgi:sterol-4alpha-carboxylate 3-dehydrogenase (decarboxylating)